MVLVLGQLIDHRLLLLHDDQLLLLELLPLTLNLLLLLLVLLLAAGNAVRLVKRNAPFKRCDQEDITNKVGRVSRRGEEGTHFHSGGAAMLRLWHARSEKCRVGRLLSRTSAPRCVPRTRRRSPPGLQGAHSVAATSYVSSTT